MRGVTLCSQIDIDMITPFKCKLREIRENRGRLQHGALGNSTAYALYASCCNLPDHRSHYIYTLSSIQ